MLAGVAGGDEKMMVGGSSGSKKPANGERRWERPAYAPHRSRVAALFVHSGWWCWREASEARPSGCPQGVAVRAPEPKFVKSVCTECAMAQVAVNEGSGSPVRQAWRRKYAQSAPCAVEENAAMWQQKCAVACAQRRVGSAWW